MTPTYKWLSAVVFACCSGAASSADSQTDGLQEIVVTAQKRSETLESVPFAVQAYTASAIENQNIIGLNQLITSVPGASEGLSSDIGNRQYQIRGMTQALGDPTIGYYVGDSAYFFDMSGMAAPAITLFDMNRVEVLRGPQGTLYGNGAMGGVIRFIPNEPNLSKVEASVRAGGSTTDGGGPGSYYDAALSLPIVADKLAVRLVGDYQRVGGYADLPAAGLRNVNDGELRNFRGSVLFVPISELKIEANVLHTSSFQHNGDALESLDPPIPTNTPGDGFRSSANIYSGTVSYDFGPATLTETGTKLDYRLNEQDTILFPLSSTGKLALFYSPDEGAFNDEIRLVSNGRTALNWVLGGYYSRSSGNAVVTSAPAFIPSDSTYDVSRSLSEFGEISYSLFDGVLTPIVGLRHFRDARREVVTPAAAEALPAIFTSTDPRFNLSYKPSANQLYYINIAKGFRSGIFNNPADCTNLHAALGHLPCELSVPPDSVWSYEAGTKQTLFDHQLVLDVDGYFVNWSNIQYPVPFFGVFQTYQIGHARLYGFEGTATYAPAVLSGFTMGSTWNLNSSKFNEVNPILVSLADIQPGSRIPFVPQWTLSLTPQYEWALGSSGWKGLAALTYNHISAQLGQAGSTVNGATRSLLGARLGVQNKTWGAYLFGTNLLNEHGAIYAQAPAGGAQTYTQDYPRQIGLELDAKY